MSLPVKVKISILGDSISTLSSYTPTEGAFYHTAFSRNTGIQSVEDTWWMKVISALDGTLLVNHSYAGSTVCRNGYQPASSPWRIAKLKKGEQLPDLILVFSGLNDVAFYRTPEEFGIDYKAMLQELSTQYPNAEIWCGTLCQGFLNHLDAPRFFNPHACLPLSDYNQMIRAAVLEAQCYLADLASFQQDYSSIDGAHPDAAGMELIAQMWLRCLLPHTPEN